MSAPTRDRLSVTADGQSIAARIEGVHLRPAITQVDERGEVTEIFNPAWGIHDAPLVYVYQVVIRPGRVKGWTIHYEQDDRLFFSMGVFKGVLFDARPTSPTFRMLNEFCLGERNRALLTVPAGVYHAFQNVGDTEALFINLPTRPYRYDRPDKFRLPLDTDEIPYRFNVRLGW
ncbi:MAG: dTDP-4-dehydrorhamnose 3,5-epimerase family protein [Chloroflexi bacterium]|nr:dTDP-4-dehydrorhamnose 3,5-epimerase family protein [Chloroflexota bacterium]